MTCVVGIVDDETSTVLLGADSAITQDSRVDTTLDDKVFMNGQVAIGAAGSVRGLQLVKYQLEWRTPPEGDLLGWMVNTFTESLRVALEAGGFTQTETDFVYLIVGIRDRLFQVDRDYVVSETARSYAAIGDGGDIAVGAMSGLLRLSDLSHGSVCLDSMTVATAGLWAATEHLSSVTPPFKFVTT